MVANLYRCFADVLDYPTPHLAGRVEDALNLLAPLDMNAARRLGRFRTVVAETPLSRLEEIYTGTFDLQPLCSPHVGYHLFGEDCRRALFMIRLKERYAALDVPPDSELPDHICAILRFLALEPESGMARDLVFEGLHPAAAKMVATFGESENPYRHVIGALVLLLEEGN
ncbi:molecular chaperone TorD family protein [Geobacter hydrogenophilus]|uniref:Nitrate reductase molybdenum cofactor assembly chaperone n=1 Tax=Geobacter hydrogenophilus TaxID=40983 RepID=A0A9W6G1K5_9BACT|nr:molecular chaperone TorD family protein [Geobacter hydrogenophilus]MBT0893344.1 molecular chaperone TorD family protein [Geobacter hydrogenophilus]GLI38801.1 hypothetical protein GHYDROH2_23020 [Geobacter hydrogenophilus]